MRVDFRGSELFVILFVLCLSTAGLAGCGGDGDPSGDGDTIDSGDTGEGPTDGDTGGDLDGDTDADTGGDTDGDADSGFDPGNPDCDPLLPEVCAMPWPSNLYLAEAPGRGTGYELAFGETTLPATGNSHVNPEPYRRMDGYSLGSPLLLHWLGLDFEASDLPRQDSLEASLTEDASIVWLKVGEDGVLERVPYFTEIDTYTGTRARERTLFVRPAVILEEGTRYVVGVRNLVDEDGETIAPSPAFQLLRDGETAAHPTLAARQARFDSLLGVLEDYGIDRGEWTIAWDFVTASTDGLHGNMLRMRDRALELMPDGAEIEITSIERFLGEPDDESDLPVSTDTLYRVEATYRSPLFMRQTAIEGGSDGWVFNTNGAGEVEEVREGGDLVHSEHKVWILVPRSALSGDPHGLMLYGHGLLGSGEQTYGGYNRGVANAHDYIYFGITMLGMGSDDVASVFALLSNLSRFPYLADRLHQGAVDSVMVARGVRNQLADALPAAIEALGVYEAEEEVPEINIDTDDLVYSGISQGGIFGATVVAISPDITRGHMGVGGNNYSTLLHRSTNFSGYFVLMSSSYRNALDRAILLSTIQLLWDGSDPVSYMHRASGEPFPGMAPSSVLLAPVRGDYQVEVQTNEFAVRSGFGIELLENYDVEREPWGITPATYPHEGSGLVLWNYGNPWPAPSVNGPPDDGMGDPHGRPRSDPDHGRQLAHFLRTGVIIDVCDGGPCLRGAAAE